VGVEAGLLGDPSSKLGEPLRLALCTFIPRRCVIFVWLEHLLISFRRVAG
jgi:hypothetical protein